jgi:hypothetical protein
MRGGGISLGGILVILGIVLIFVWSFWWGLIIGIVGLLYFVGFARGKWYKSRPPCSQREVGAIAGGDY